MPDTTPPRPSHYVDVATLSRLVRDYRRTGVCSVDLALALGRMAEGVWDRYRYTADREDFTQDCVLHLLGAPLKKCDPHKHCFNWFSTCIKRFGGKLRNKEAAELRRFRAYAEHLAESGVPIPEKG